MNELRIMRQQIDQALAFAHAALEDPTARSILEAKVRGEGVLPRLASMSRSALSLADARQLFERVSQLRAVLTVIDRKLGRAEALEID